VDKAIPTICKTACNNDPPLAVIGVQNCPIPVSSLFCRQVGRRRAAQEMLTVETIRKVRLSVHRDGKSIRQTARDLRVSRNTVRKVIRTQQTGLQYKRWIQPLSQTWTLCRELGRAVIGSTIELGYPINRRERLNLKFLGNLNTLSVFLF
jgi:hypothetical protein